MRVVAIENDVTLQEAIVVARIDDSLIFADKVGRIGGSSKEGYILLAMDNDVRKAVTSPLNERWPAAEVVLF